MHVENERGTRWRKGEKLIQGGKEMERDRIQIAGKDEAWRGKERGKD